MPTAHKNIYQDTGSQNNILTKNTTIKYYSPAKWYSYRKIKTRSNTYTQNDPPSPMHETQHRDTYTHTIMLAHTNPFRFKILVFILEITSRKYFLRLHLEELMIFHVWLFEIWSRKGSKSIYSVLKKLYIHVPFVKLWVVNCRTFICETVSWADNPTFDFISSATFCFTCLSMWVCVWVCACVCVEFFCRNCVYVFFVDTFCCII